MRFKLFCLLSILLTACTTPQLPISKESHEQAALLQQHNKSLTSWDITASTSLATEDNSYSLTVYWHQKNDRYDLRFDAPFTTGVLKVKGHNGFAEITVDNKKTIQGNNPEDLIAEATQFNIPVTGLTHWIKGIPHLDTESKVTIFANGDTKAIQQDGWFIQYENWRKVDIAQSIYRLPSNIKLSQAELDIRISPSDWVKPKPVKSNPLFSDLN